MATAKSRRRSGTSKKPQKRLAKRAVLTIMSLFFSMLSLTLQFAPSFPKALDGTDLMFGLGMAFFGLYFSTKKD
jgi:hypothetical protein